MTIVIRYDDRRSGCGQLFLPPDIQSENNQDDRADDTQKEQIAQNGVDHEVLVAERFVSNSNKR